MITTQHSQEGLSRAYVSAVAFRAGSNLEFGPQLARSREFDYKVDGSFIEIEKFGKVFSESGTRVDFQLKSTTKWKINRGTVTYALDVNEYNDLARRTERFRKERIAPKILIVYCMPPDHKDWVHVDEDRILIRKCCYWTIVESKLSTNRDNTTIIIPRTQVFKPETLTDVFKKLNEDKF